MPDISKLQGTPWHAERVHRAEGDDRRYKGRCKYYVDSNKQCRRKYGKCIGSAHCDEYDAMTDEEFKNKQAKARKLSKKIGEDDCYWY